MALDSKPLGCDRVKLKVSDVVYSCSFPSRATVIQQKIGIPALALPNIGMLKTTVTLSRCCLTRLP